MLENSMKHRKTHVKKTHHGGNGARKKAERERKRLARERAIEAKAVARNKKSLNKSQISTQVQINENPFSTSSNGIQPTTNNTVQSVATINQPRNNVNTSQSINRLNTGNRTNPFSTEPIVTSKKNSQDTNNGQPTVEVKKNNNNAPAQPVTEVRRNNNNVPAQPVTEVRRNNNNVPAQTTVEVRRNNNNVPAQTTVEVRRNNNNVPAQTTIEVRRNNNNSQPTQTTVEVRRNNNNSQPTQTTVEVRRNNNNVPVQTTVEVRRNNNNVPVQTTVEVRRNNNNGQSMTNNKSTQIKKEIRNNMSLAYEKTMDRYQAFLHHSYQSFFDPLMQLCQQLNQWNCFTPYINVSSEIQMWYKDVSEQYRQLVRNVVTDPTIPLSTIYSKLSVGQINPGSEICPTTKIGKEFELFGLDSFHHHWSVFCNHVTESLLILLIKYRNNTTDTFSKNIQPVLPDNKLTVSRALYKDQSMSNDEKKYTLGQLGLTADFIMYVMGKTSVKSTFFSEIPSYIQQLDTYRSDIRSLGYDILSNELIQSYEKEYSLIQTHYKIRPFLFFLTLLPMDSYYHDLLQANGMVKPIFEQVRQIQPVDILSTYPQFLTYAFMDTMFRDLTTQLGRSAILDPYLRGVYLQFSNGYITENSQVKHGFMSDLYNQSMTTFATQVVSKKGVSGNSLCNMLLQQAYL
jgi:hypothetical protein